MTLSYLRDFIQQNKRKILPVMVFIICFVFLLTFNMYKLMFSLTRVEILGSPPVQAVRIVSLEPRYDWRIEGNTTYVYVKTVDNKVYGCCRFNEGNDWIIKEEYDPNTTEEIECAERLRKNWKISDSHDNVIDSMSVGQCDDSSLDLYSSYQIRSDGSIWGKTLTESLTMEIMSAVQWSCTFPVFFIVFFYYLFFNPFKKEA